MGISEVLTARAEPAPAAPAPPIDLSRPIPSWNTPEFPAEWPGSDPMPTEPRHVYILSYLQDALTRLLELRGRPFGISQDTGLHFFDAAGKRQRCDPDLIVMPFPNTERGSLRRWDMPCPPDCVIEVASPSTIQRDLGIKKEWYEGMGVREYWVLDPVVSDDPDDFKDGVLMPDGPLTGWSLVQGRYDPLPARWVATARTWSAHSPALDCEILFAQSLHAQKREGGYRIINPDSGQAISSTREKDAALEEKSAALKEKDAALGEKTAALKEKDAALEEKASAIGERDSLIARQRNDFGELTVAFAADRFGPAAAEELSHMMNRSAVSLPDWNSVRVWLNAPSALAFLQLARRHFGMTASRD